MKTILIIVLFILAPVVSFASDWPSSVCYEKLMSEDCVDDFVSIEVDLKMGEKNYCVKADFHSLDYFPNRLDEEVEIYGEDIFTAPMKITHRTTLFIVCEYGHE